jgi:hypothetical protein
MTGLPGWLVVGGFGLVYLLTWWLGHGRAKKHEEEEERGEKPST